VEKIIGNHQDTESPNVEDSMVDDQPVMSTVSEEVLPVQTKVSAVDYNQVAAEPERVEDEDEIT